MNFERFQAKPQAPHFGKFDSASNGLVGVEFHEFCKNVTKILELGLGTLANESGVCDSPPDEVESRWLGAINASKVEGLAP